MSKSKKLPYMPFYVGDLKREAHYKTLPPLAKLLWLEILFVMWDSELRGMLILNGKPMTEKQIASVTELDIRLVKQNLPIIKESQICSITEDGVIYCRSMTRRCALSVKRSETGKLGGNPNLLNQNESKNNIKDKQSLDIENDNEIDINKIILPPDFDTPEMAEAVSRWKGKLKTVNRTYNQITFDSHMMRFGTAEAYIAAVNHSCGMSKTYNLYPPDQKETKEELPPGWTWLDKQNVKSPEGKTHHISFLRNMQSLKTAQEAAQ